MPQTVLDAVSSVESMRYVVNAIDGNNLSTVPSLLWQATCAESSGNRPWLQLRASLASIVIVWFVEGSNLFDRQGLNRRLRNPSPEAINGLV